MVVVVSGPTFEQTLAKSRADARPAPPDEGVPAQRLPGFVRRGIQLVVVPYLWLDDAVAWLLRGVLPPPYRLEGACHGTGACCRYVLVHFPRVVARSRVLSGLLWWWTTEVNGFFPREFELDEVEPGARTWVMSCRHLQADGRCATYRFRPQLCRRWPRQSHVARPFVLKGCGYRVVARDGQALPERATKLPIVDE